MQENLNATIQLPFFTQELCSQPKVMSLAFGNPDVYLSVITVSTKYTENGAGLTVLRDIYS